MGPTRPRFLVLPSFSVRVRRTGATRLYIAARHRVESQSIFQIVFAPCHTPRHRSAESTAGHIRENQDVTHQDRPCRDRQPHCIYSVRIRRSPLQRLPQTWVFRRIAGTGLCCQHSRKIECLRLQGGTSESGYSRSAIPVSQGWHQRPRHLISRSHASGETLRNRLRPGRTGPSLPASARGYAVCICGGWLGRISANATWMMPPARPSATPIRHAMV
jgi:hypothetical protein